MRRYPVRSLTAATALLLVTGCGSQHDITHPIDAAENFMGALADGDLELMCDLVADPDEGPFPEGSRPECEQWASQVVRGLSEHDRKALAEARISSVTLDGGDAAQVRAEDFEDAPPRLSRLDLIEWGGRWYVEDVRLD